LAFVPLICLGILNAPLFAVAAARTRSLWLTLSTIGYLACTVVIFITTESTTLLGNAAFGTALVVNMFGGTAHAIIIRGRVLRGKGPETNGDGRASISDEPAIQAALVRRQRRQHARHLLATDPHLASELRIGRPDLPRQFDDGGLVDINNVPPHVLTQLPGVTADIAEQLAAAARSSDLTCAEDLVIYANMSPALAESLREQLVFRPRIG
jgi:hypothetical protein